jgi:queuine tRNA-ribosyltransferase
VQNLFPIVQGGLNKQLRKECVEALVARNAPGYAIGGLSGGEEKTQFVEIVHYTAQPLPKDKPIYLMGVGHPVDILVCACLGVDMFDCVFPTRTARFGTAFSQNGDIRLKHSKFKLDMRPIDDTCTCETCQNYIRAFLNTIVTKQEVAAHMLSKHNIHFNLNLLRGLQTAIDEENTEEYVRNFLKNWFRDDAKLPEWVELGLKLAKINHENIF